MAERAISRLAPWSGLAGGALAWGVQYQFLVDLLHFSCPPALRAIALASGALAACLAAAAGFGSWQSLRARPAGGADVRRFIARLGLLAAVFALIAIALQTAAALILPPCVA